MVSDVQSEPRPATPPRRIVLTGFMGSGKTTVGPLVARHLGWKFIDVDDVIEEETGVKITEIFARYGEPAFREREHATIARLATDDGLVLALGGGAIERAETRNLILAAPATLLIHLEVELATTLARCSGTENTRPVLADQTNLAISLRAPSPALPHRPRVHPRRHAHTRPGGRCHPARCRPFTQSTGCSSILNHHLRDFQSRWGSR